MRPEYWKRPHSRMLLGVSQASCAIPRNKRNTMTRHSELSRKESTPALSAQKPIINELLETRALGLTNIKVKPMKKRI